MSRQRRTTPKTMRRAGKLRKELTPAERKLWGALRRDQLNGWNFRRQHAIGKFITDFCCIKGKLIVEVDGGHHASQIEYDQARTEYLESRGYRVIRFWNRDVMNDLPTVLRAIHHALSPPNAAAQTDF